MGILLRRLDAGDTFEIDTPNAAITLLRPGEYRVDVDTARDETAVTVHAGTAQAATMKETHAVYPPQEGILKGSKTEYKLAPAPAAGRFRRILRDARPLRNIDPLGRAGFPRLHRRL